MAATREAAVNAILSSSRPAAMCSILLAGTLACSIDKGTEAAPAERPEAPASVDALSPARSNPSRPTQPASPSTPAQPSGGGRNDGAGNGGSEGAAVAPADTVRPGVS